MGSVGDMEQLLWGTLGDASGASQGVAKGGTKGGGGGRKSVGGVGKGNQSTRVGREGGAELDWDQEGADEMVEGGGPGESGFFGGASGRKTHVAGGGTDPQGGRGLTHYRPRGGGVEGIGGDY